MISPIRWKPGMVISEPGFYMIPAKDYHADPCPDPSLSGSIAVPLVHRSPHHAWWNHPRLNPEFEREESSRLDLGSVAHALLLKAGAEIEVVLADDYRTKAAQQARDAAREAGKIPVLSDQYDNASCMAAVANDYLRAAIGWGSFGGVAETVMIWRENDAWLRGMVDWMRDDMSIVLDYKTTSASARPEDIVRSLFDLNYHLKAAFYERGLNVLDPPGIGRRKFLLLFQEIDPPYECSLIQMSENALTIGRKQATYAIRLWQRCIATGDWPGYGISAFAALPPPWIEQRWLEREMTDPFATGETYPGEMSPVIPLHGKKGF